MPVGENTVSFTAIDDYGNVSICEVNVLVGEEADEISLHPEGPIEASLAEDETNQTVTWNPLNTSTACKYCTKREVKVSIYPNPADT